MGLPLLTQPQASDLNRQRGIDAYRLTSFTPDKRADGDIASYVKDVLQFAEELEGIADTEAEIAEAVAQVERFRLKSIEWTNVLWAAKSRTASPMITGPARFPVDRNRKAMDAEMKKIKAFVAWLPKAQAAARRAVLSAGVPAEEKAPAKAAEVIAIGGVEIVTNYEAERVQILFPGKPDAETIERLKGAAWKWSPRNKAWQRMITPASLRSAKQIAEGFNA